MLLGEAPGELPQGKRLAGEGAKGGAEGSADKCGGEPFSCNVGDHHEMRAIGFGYDVEVVSTDLVAGAGTGRHGVAGDNRHSLGEQALLDGAGGIEVLGETGVIHVALVVDGVLYCYGGLQDEAFKEVSFVEA